MPRLKNIINSKDRKTSCVMTEQTITYKIPLGAEEQKLGHFVETVLEGNFMIVRYAAKKEVPEFRKESTDPFVVSFD